MTVQLAVTVRTRELIRPGEFILVACSGGPDSLALLDLLAALRERLGFSLAACYVDHGLRPAAHEEAALVTRFARARGIPVATLALTLDGTRGNLMARARAARYAALEEHRRAIGAASIALGHTLNDQVETLLMRLLDGSGSRGLAAMAWRREDLIRPLLETSRDEIERYLDAHDLKPVRDPSNHDPRFRRVQMRSLLPGFAGKPQELRAIGRAAANLRDDADVLAWVEEELLERVGRGDRLDLRRLASLPRAVKTRALLAFLRHHDAGPLSRREIQAVTTLCEDFSGTKELTVGALRLERSYGWLAIRAAPAAPPEPVFLTAPGQITFGRARLTIKLTAPVMLRSPHPGDRVALHQAGHSTPSHKKLARLFIDAKVPRNLRAAYPVLVQAESQEIWCVPHLYLAARSPVTAEVSWLTQGDAMQ